MKHSTKSRITTGRLIVFEGPDESGKTTTSKRLVRLLRKKGKTVHWLSFPGREPGSLGAAVYALHHDRKSRYIHPLSLQFLHLAAHIDLIERRILPALKQGEWVVLDRFWWSTYVYGLAEGADQIALELGLRAEHYLWGPFKPERVFLLFRPSIRRSKFSSALRKHYSALAKRESQNYPVTLVLNNSTLSNLLNKVISHLEPWVNR